MTNAEKFKTADERAKAFGKWCERTKIHDSYGDAACAVKCGFCHFAWLDLEAYEEILPCPFCGRKCTTSSERKVVVCSNCSYTSIQGWEMKDTIAAHNRVARAVIAAGKKEEK